MKKQPLTLADLAAALGAMTVDEFPTARAARAAAELVEEVRRLRRGELTATEKAANPHGLCFACGFPNRADGCCSRLQCCNSD